MATLACRVTKLKRAQLGHETRKEAKFGQNRSTLSTRYAAHRETDGRTDTFTDNKGHLIIRRSKNIIPDLTGLLELGQQNTV